MLQSFDLFGELAYNEIHYMDGSNEQKALYHAVVGGIMSKLTGGDFLAGATAAGINKLVIEEVKKAANYEPDKMQWVSAVLGAVVAEFVSGNPQVGGSVAASGTKNNRLSVPQYEDFKRELSKAKSNAERLEILERYLKKDLNQEQAFIEKLKDQEFVNRLINALDENPSLEIFEGIVIQGYSIIGNKQNNNYLQTGVGELVDDSDDKKFLYHEDHPLYDGETGTTDLLSPMQKFINDHKSSLGNLSDNVAMSYITSGADKIINKLPDKISVNEKQCDVYVNGIKVLKSVSASDAVTIGEGVYDIYVDYNKYSGRTFNLNVLPTISTVAISVHFSNSLESKFGEKLGYLLPLVDGSVAYLISSGSSEFKSYISKD